MCIFLKFDAGTLTYLCTTMSVVNVKVSHIRPSGFENLEEWISDPMNVYIGRKGIVFVGAQRFPKDNSPWANPFKVGRHGTREDVLEKYKKYITSNPELMARLPELRGKTLGCWCKPEKCHGDILLELLAGLV